VAGEGRSGRKKDVVKERDVVAGETWQERDIVEGERRSGMKTNV
jgi:hypothetical protein